MESNVCVLCYNENETSLQDSTSLIEDCAGVNKDCDESKENNKLLLCYECIKSVNQSISWVHKCREALKTLLPFSKVICKIEKEESVESMKDFIKQEVEVDFQNDDPLNDVKSEDDEDDDDDDSEEEKDSVKAKNQCNICNIIRPSKSALLDHLRTHTGEKPYKCSNCDKCFTQKGTLVEHERRLHGTPEKFKNSTCDFCGKCFHRSTDLRVHLRTHTKEKPYSCPFCPKSFTQIGSLINHKMVHTGEKKFSCEVCGKRFIASTALKRHMNVHSDERAFTCHICNKALKTKAALQIHIDNIHGGNKKSVCDICGKSCSSVFVLRTHKATQHSELSGKCEECNKIFPNLEEHRRIHTGEKPYQCDICSKHFAFKRSLKTHLNKHAQNDKLPCSFEECSKRFSSQALLDYHVLKYHSKLVPYSCSKCSRGFYRANDLARHTNCKRKNYYNHTP